SPIAASLTRAIAVAFFFQALAVVPAALLLKHFRFGLHEGLQTAMGLFSMAAWALLAANGWGAWSLVLPSVVVSAFWAAVTWLATGFRPLLRPGRAALADILRFSRSLSASQLVTYLQANLDQAAVGTLGQAPLGWYTFGESQSAFAVTGLGAPVASVALPAMAAVRERLEDVAERLDAIRTIYLDMLRLAATLSTPMQIGTIVLTDLGVRVLFGPQWLGAVPVLRAYLTFRLVQVLLALSDATTSAAGRPDLRFAVQLAQLPFFAAGTWFGLNVWGGIVGVAWSLAIVRTIAGLVYLAATLRLTRTNPGALLRFLLPSTLAGAAMAIVVYAVRDAGIVRGLLSFAGDARLLDGADLLALTLAGVAVYFPLLFLLDPQGFRAIVTTVREVILPGLQRGPNRHSRQAPLPHSSIDTDVHRRTEDP
ncbi:MAG TPA: oligosaccharide flippase family protein, partial [Anaerolineae bacterium]|nr:oligosaccharide flippase family protein [Anaerolineae bacterium]